MAVCTKCAFLPVKDNKDAQIATIGSLPPHTIGVVAMISAWA